MCPRPRFFQFTITFMTLWLDARLLYMYAKVSSCFGLIDIFVR